jgi:hypothetical protein
MTQAIIYPQDNGNIALVIPSGELPIEEVARKDVPADKPHLIVAYEDIPADHTFFGAWEADFNSKTNAKVLVNITKAKAIGHTIRRQKREEEFKPLDDVIVKQIPGTDVKAVEAKRQKIRDKYVKVQVAIDAATTPEAIKEALR